MADSISALLREIRKAAQCAGVDFVLHRKGKKHAIYHLGSTVMLPIPHSQVPDRIRQEILRQCEPELGQRWWIEGARRAIIECEITGNSQRNRRGHRGPRR
jgi:hypothetical protein